MANHCYNMMSRPSIDERALLSILKRCKELTAASDDSDWSSMNVSDIAVILDRSIRGLQDASPIDVDTLRFLFAPTGPLQETSMDNGWAEEFLQLAERFDHIIGKSH